MNPRPGARKSPVTPTDDEPGDMNRFLKASMWSPRARSPQARGLASKVRPTIDAALTITIVVGWVAVAAIIAARGLALRERPSSAKPAEVSGFATEGTGIASRESAESESENQPRAERPRATMIAIPAGIYEPFYKSETGARSIPVAAFLLDERPVTKAEFLEFVREHPPWRRSRVTPLLAEPNYLQDWQADLDPGSALDEPVTFVSWFAARAYCASVGKRLPTVAEWERIAGGGTTGSASRRETGTIGRDGASPFAFAMGRVPSDASGNPTPVFGAVWEWTSDFNSNLVSGRLGEASAPNLFCGAGIRAVDATDYAGFLRYSFRSSLRANYALRNLGFRCARDL